MSDSIDSLRHLIQTHPLIDNHAHNILNRHNASNYDKYPFESITSEAQGPALENAYKTLPHYRAIDQLASLFSCAPDWDKIKSTRDQWIERDYSGLVKKCLDGTQTLLLDDLLTASDVEPYGWHDQFTASPTKRIVRIEAVAENILTELRQERAKEGKAIGSLGREFDVFSKQFRAKIEAAVKAPEVAGFKSVVCYRTGLDVSMADEEDRLVLVSSFLGTAAQHGDYRIEDKPFNDWLVRHTLDILDEAQSSKPLQFHTGLGDVDIDLLRSNPAHMQPLVDAYPNVNFVLLHSSYPYTREAGYLACVYPNVYLDLGEVFPMVSRDAEESIIREALEIVPTNRLLWSTDGHFFPETYWLANKQFRDALENVLVGYVERGDFTISRAREVASDILFNNSNVLYSLEQSANYESSTVLPISVTHKIVPQNDTSESALDEFLKRNPSVEFIWLQWVDFTATVRLRMFPLREFRRIVRKERRIGITKAAFYLLQDDSLVDGGSATGQFYLQPDLSSLSRNVGISSNSASVMTFWPSETGDEIEECPRTRLQGLVTKLKEEYGIDVTFGFEIEVVFLKEEMDLSGGKHYVPFVTNHSWSNMTSETRKVLPLLEKIVKSLASIDIYVEQFHAESSPSQFEFVLPPDNPLAAVDTLIKARQTITNIAEQHGLRATLYPRPYPKAAGTASHAHLSISPADSEESFLAGILQHFPEILAFTLSQDVSYERVVSGIWAGGEWVAWGTQNRETPIRKISKGHWELKSLDGLANMYFAMSAVLAAGYLGLREKLPLTLKDCAFDVSTLSEAERKDLGITTRLPKTLEEALRNLQGGKALQELLGPNLVNIYTAVKRAESQKLSAIEETQRTVWVVERY